MLSYIEEVHPDCVPNPNQKLNRPQEIPADKQEAITQMNIQIGKHIEEENECSALFSDKNILFKEKAGSEKNSPTKSYRTLVGNDEVYKGEVEIVVKETQMEGRRKNSDITNKFIAVKPLQNQTTNLPVFQRSRLLQNHLGFLSYNSLLQDDKYHLMSKSSAMYRDIKGLDKKYG